MYMWCKMALIFNCAIMMDQFTKHALFENAFNDCLDHIMEIFYHCQRILQQGTDSLSIRVLFQNEAVHIYLNFSIEESQLQMSIFKIDG